MWDWLTGLFGGGEQIDKEDLHSAWLDYQEGDDAGGMGAAMGPDTNCGLDDEFAFDSYARDAEDPTPILGYDDEGEAYEMIGDHDGAPY